MPPTVEPYTCTVMTDREGVAALRQEWGDLLLRSARPTPFLSWEWMSVWLDTLGRAETPYVLLLRRQTDGRLTGLAPLVRLRPRPPFWLRAIRFMGAGVGADHLAFLSPAGMEPAVVHHLAAFLFSQDNWDLLELPRLQAAFADLLGAAAAVWAAERFSIVRAVADLCPYIPLPRTWEEYLVVLPLKRRRDTEREWRRLNEQGEVTIERVATRDALAQAWPVLLQLHRMRRRGLSAFATPPSIAFHQEFLPLALQEGWLRFYLLRVNGEDVAGHYCLHLGDLVLDFQTGFDERWRRFGVGTLLREHAIREAIREGAGEFDLLRGAEPYKQRAWAAQVRSDVSLTIYRPRPQIWLARAIRRWGEVVRGRLRE